MGPNFSAAGQRCRVADYPLPYGGETNFSNYGNIRRSSGRIEVLTGASAIYGSDAIAGVVNVILRPATTATRVRGRYLHRRWTRYLGPVLGRRQDRRQLERDLRAAVHQARSAVRTRPTADGRRDDAPYPSWNMEQRKVGFHPTSGLALIDPTNGQRLAPPAHLRSSTAVLHRRRLVYNYATNTITNTGTCAA